MKKRILLAAVLACVLYVPNAHAQSSSVDLLLLRIDKLILEMQQVKKEVEAMQNKPGGSVLGAQTSAVFTESLAYGETNDDIAKIQKLLATDPEIYPYGVVSGFFGPNTEEAIRNLQSRFGLDPVGAIGPATTALLEGYMRAHPDENYPSDVLKSKPQVLGASTSNTGTNPIPAPSGASTNPLSSLDVEVDWKEASVVARYNNGEVKRFYVSSDDEDEIVELISDRIDVSESHINQVISFDGSDNDNDHDENDAEDALEEAEEAIDAADEEIFDAEQNGEDVDYALDTLDEAEDRLNDAEDAFFDDEDWDEAVELAEEAKDLAEEAEDRIGEDEDEDEGDSDDIESIVAEVDEDETEVTVEYGDGDEETFTVEEDTEDDIIEAIADELNIDEDDVEDLIEFDFGDLDSIEVLITDGEAEVEITYESGVTRRFTLDEDDEDSLIEEIADEIDEDADDVEDVTEFDYN